MADIKANPELRRKQIKLKISELELNLLRMDVRKCELDDEKSKIDVNIEATIKAINDLKKEIGE